jgi:hypothetical protein
MFGWLRREPAHIAERRRQVCDALVGYPPYQPPKWDIDAISMGEANVEYRQFFFGERGQRLEALRNFLEKFCVILSLEDAGILEVSAWCPTFADLFVPGLERDAVRDAYQEFETPWTGDLLGLNPIFDLGVYFGECLLLRNPRLEWKPGRGPEPTFVSHHIFGQKSGRPFDPVADMYTRCRNIQATNKLSGPCGREFIQPDSLSRAIHAHVP